MDKLFKELDGVVCEMYLEWKRFFEAQGFEEKLLYLQRFRLCRTRLQEIDSRLTDLLNGCREYRYRNP